MTGFEPRTSGIGSNRSTNWATTTAPKFRLRSKKSKSLSMCLLPTSSGLDQPTRGKNPKISHKIGFFSQIIWEQKEEGGIKNWRKILDAKSEQRHGDTYRRWRKTSPSLVCVPDREREGERCLPAVVAVRLPVAVVTWRGRALAGWRTGHRRHGGDDSIFTATTIFACDKMPPWAAPKKKKCLRKSLSLSLSLSNTHTLSLSLSHTHTLSLFSFSGSTVDAVFSEGGHS